MTRAFCSQCGMPFPTGGFGNSVGLTSKSAETAGAWRSGDSFLPHGERRQVSIMFSDIIGSAALSESLRIRRISSRLSVNTRQRAQRSLGFTKDISPNTSVMEF